jgi:hypothetical protein
MKYGEYNEDHTQWVGKLDGKVRRWYDVVTVSSELFKIAERKLLGLPDDRIDEYKKIMEEDYDGTWGDFPPIYGRIRHVKGLHDKLNRGPDRLRWSRPLTEKDIGKEYTVVGDGHARAYAAQALGIGIRVVDSKKFPKKTTRKVRIMKCALSAKKGWNKVK